MSDITIDGIVIKAEERQRCEVWTRVMGYHRPVQSFNIGKKGEFAERLAFSEPAACKCAMRPAENGSAR